MKKYTLLYLLEFFDYDTMKIDRWNKYSNIYQFETSIHNLVVKKFLFQQELILPPHHSFKNLKNSRYHQLVLIVHLRTSLTYFYHHGVWWKKHIFKFNVHLKLASLVSNTSPRSFAPVPWKKLHHVFSTHCTETTTARFF